MFHEITKLVWQRHPPKRKLGRMKISLLMLMGLVLVRRENHAWWLALGARFFTRSWRTKLGVWCARGGGGCGRNSVPKESPVSLNARSPFVSNARGTGRAPIAGRWFCRRNLVLPEGIELSTSPLPRECSTTELRQPALSFFLPPAPNVAEAAGARGGI